jgi:hypothetical protein
MHGVDPTLPPWGEVHATYFGVKQHPPPKRQVTASSCKRTWFGYPKTQIAKSFNWLGDLDSNQD